MGLNVAVLANLKKNAPRFGGMPADQWDDLDSDVTINSIVAALETCGHGATFLEGNLSLVETLPRLKPDICFNICEGHWGDSRESHIPALLEMLRIPYTGARVLALALTLDKPMTKRVLHFHGLPTPAFQVFERPNEPLDADLCFPLFVKPSREGTGMGVTADSIVQNERELRERLAGHLDRYDQPILVERYVRGRDLARQDDLQSGEQALGDARLARQPRVLQHHDAALGFLGRDQLARLHQVRPYLGVAPHGGHATRRRLVRDQPVQHAP